VSEADTEWQIRKSQSEWAVGINKERFPPLPRSAANYKGIDTQSRVCDVILHAISHTHASYTTLYTRAQSKFVLKTRRVNNFLALECIGVVPFHHSIFAVKKLFMFEKKWYGFAILTD
jgi:hypothetical protein